MGLQSKSWRSDEGGGTVGKINEVHESIQYECMEPRRQDEWLVVSFRWRSGDLNLVTRCIWVVGANGRWCYSSIRKEEAHTYGEGMLKVRQALARLGLMCYMVSFCFDGLWWANACARLGGERCYDVFIIGAFQLGVYS